MKARNKDINFLKLYDPYANRNFFWEYLRDEGLLMNSNLIAGEDLNIVTSSIEVWGVNSRTNALAHFFKSLFEEAGLVDVEPIPLRPTWKNRISGEVGIAKQLNCFCWQRIYWQVLISFNHG